MAIVQRGFIQQNVIACYYETAGGGNWDDFNAPRNAPARDPQGNMGSIVWHSSFYQFQLAFPEQVKVINHPQVAGETRYMGVLVTSFPGTTPGGVQQAVYGKDQQTDHTLYTHDLGYKPLVFVSYNGHMLGAGETVQTDGDKSRTVSVFVTNNIVGLREVARSDGNALGAVDRTYRVLIFAKPEPVPGKVLFQGPSPVELARGTIGGGRSMLRKAGQGSTSYALNLGRTLDLGGGRSRFATGGQNIDEPGYTGSHSAPAFRSVGV